MSDLLKKAKLKEYLSLKNIYKKTLNNSYCTKFARNRVSYPSSPLRRCKAVVIKPLWKKIQVGINLKINFLEQQLGGAFINNHYTYCHRLYQNKTKAVEQRTNHHIIINWEESYRMLPRLFKQYTYLLRQTCWAIHRMMAAVRCIYIYRLQWNMVSRDKNVLHRRVAITTEVCVAYV